MVTCGDDCWVRLFEKASGELFAECPLPLDKPLISVWSLASQCFGSEVCASALPTVILHTAAAPAECLWHDLLICMGQQSCKLQPHLLPPVVKLDCNGLVLTFRWWSLLWTAAATMCSVSWTAYRSATPSLA